MHVVVQIGLVSLGSALGGLLRWGVGLGFGQLFGTAFPWGTFFINISGSMFLGWFTTMLGERMVNGGFAWLRPDDLRLLLAVGFTGAYTTFSTFEYEAEDMLRNSANFKGMVYIVGSVALGLIAVRLGALLARSH